LNYQEEVIEFSCRGDSLIGVLARPAAPKPVGVVIIVGGPQYRAGSHRQFVLLSRALAAGGFAVLRFDYRGMGDSEGDMRDFEHITEDVSAAVDSFQSTAPEIKKYVLWGLCDGASAALLYCHATLDPRIHGLCLLNPWVRSEVSLARTQIKHYYSQRLLQREFWNKLLTGKVAWSALHALTNNLKSALGKTKVGVATAQSTFQDRMAASWTDFDGPMLLLLSGDDYTAKEFLEYIGSNPAWANATSRIGLIQQTVPDADHTFSEIRLNAVVEKCALDFLNSPAFR
jgi:uncharacterized protein